MPDSLHRHLDALRAHLPGAMAEALMQGWLEALRDPAVAQTPEENRRAAGWAMQLRSERSRVQAQLAEALGEAMDATLQARRLLPPEALRAAASDPLSLAGLTLLDEEQAECDIEISRLAQRIQQAAEASWTPLWARISRLPFDALSGLPLDLEHYPGDPAALARGVGQGVQRLCTSPAQRALLMRLAPELCGPVVKAAFAQALPTLEGLPTAATHATPQDAPHPATLLHELLRRMAHDPRLPPALQAQVARLEAPLLRLLPEDPALLSHADHPAWLFIEELAAHAAELPEPATARRAALLELVHQHMNALQADPHPDRLQQALAALRTLLARDAEAQSEAQRSDRQALHRAERERALLPLLQQQMADQLSRNSVPAPARLRRFLTSTWAEVLARVMAQHGPDSREAQPLLAWVDDLLASLQPPADEAARQRTVRTLPALLARLHEGMNVVDLPAVQRDDVLDALMLAHRSLLFTARPSPAQALQADPPAQVPQPPPAAEMLWDDSEHREQAADHWHAVDTSIGALPTVPMPLHAQHDAERGARWLAGLRPGMRCKLFLQGTWTTARLTWRSDNGQFFMFASSLGSGSHSMTRRALERLRGEGLATEVGANNLLERAMQGWLQDSQPMPL